LSTDPAAAVRASAAARQYATTTTQERAASHQDQFYFALASHPTATLRGKVLKSADVLRLTARSAPAPVYGMADESGCNSYIVKPTDFIKFVEVASQILKLPAPAEHRA